ncbi:MAG: YddF family protein [Candidatus Micrarchaeota archaeon]|nr:YddF family protein [Thermodesulfovibrio sp.]MCX8167272.1 YddF family protein [Candidatus Micrarchaeota archaeon]MDW7998077.1 DUF1874 domain-containing protein [Thermodesulfovibrio sp.]
MKVKLLNSAMMPNEGIYVLKRITKEQFCKELIEAYQQNRLESYIGYQDNIDLIAKWTGVIIPFSRETASTEDGDVLLIMKLKKRMGDPSMKGKLMFSDEDFEFFKAEYKTLKEEI